MPPPSKTMTPEELQMLMDFMDKGYYASAVTEDIVPGRHGQSVRITHSKMGQDPLADLPANYVHGTFPTRQATTGDRADVLRKFDNSVMYFSPMDTPLRARDQKNPIIQDLLKRLEEVELGEPPEIDTFAHATDRELRRFQTFERADERADQVLRRAMESGTDTSDLRRRIEDFADRLIGRQDDIHMGVEQRVLTQTPELAYEGIISPEEMEEAKNLRQGFKKDRAKLFGKTMGTTFEEVGNSGTFRGLIKRSPLAALMFMIAAGGGAAALGGMDNA